MAEDISEEEKKLIKALRELNVQPKADSAADLQTWLTGFSTDHGDTKPVIETAATVSNQVPRLSIFYGDTSTLTKGEAIYDQWRYELIGLLKDKEYKESRVLQAVRRSVRGDASEIIRSMGTDVGISEIIENLDSVYGVIESKETLMSQFYSATQREDEDVTAWSCRIEGILNRAVEKGMVKRHEVNDMLRSKFWKGMKQRLKDITGYKFDNIKNFKQLRVEVRMLEQEHMEKKEDIKVVTIKSATETDTDSLRGEIQELKTVVASLAASVTNINKRMDKGDNQPSDKGREHRDRDTGYQQQPRSYYQREQPYQREDRRGYRQSQHQQTRGRSSSRGRYNSDRGNYGSTRQPYRPEFSSEDIDPNAHLGPICYRCRQRGHYKWQCRTILDHSHHLN